MQQLKRVVGCEPLYGRVNPQWVRLLDVLGMNVDYVRARAPSSSPPTGAASSTSTRATASTTSATIIRGSCRRSRTSSIAADRRCCRATCPSSPASLAARLCARAGGRLRKVFFASSGSEGVEAVIKFARAHTGASGHPLRGGRVPRAHLRRVVADGQSLLDRRLRAAAAGDAGGAVRDLEALGGRARHPALRRARARADPGRGRRRRADGGVSPSGAGALPALRDALRRRRGADRPLSHRDRFSPRSTSASSPTWSCWRRR